MNNNKGFSLIEMLVTMAVFLLILIPVYLMIFHYGDVYQTENARIKLQQESRFLMTNLTTELKSVGSVLTLSNSVLFLKDTAYFNGIIPINNNDYADGIIVATGEPNAVTKLGPTSTYDANSGGLVLTVEDTSVPPGTRAWSSGDIGILIGTKGYLVFMVSGTAAPPVTATTITMRTLADGGPVYFSGLLNTIADMDLGFTYEDPETGDKGNAVIYEVGSPVVRLTNFAIYLLRTIDDPERFRRIRQFIRITDAKNQADVLDEGRDVIKTIISENIYDMQISYTTYPNFPDTTPTNKYFSGGSSSVVTSDLLDDIRAKNLRELDIKLLVLTEKFGGRASEADIKQTVPPFADLVQSYELPEGKYSYKVFSFLVELRNYNIVKEL